MGKHSNWKHRGLSNPVRHTADELMRLRNSQPYSAGELTTEAAELAFEHMTAVGRENGMSISRRVLRHVYQSVAERLPDNAAPFWEPQNELTTAYEGLSHAFEQVRTKPNVMPQQ